MSLIQQQTTYFSHAHRIYVKALYKRECLEARAMNFARRRDWERQCVEIRVEYEAARSLSDPRAIGAWVRDREQALVRNYSGNPIIFPRMPGGSLYERNTPPPQFTASEWAASDGFGDAQELSAWQMHQMRLRARAIRQLNSDRSEAAPELVAADIEAEKKHYEDKVKREEDLWERGGGR